MSDQKRLAARLAKRKLDVILMKSLGTPESVISHVRSLEDELEELKNGCVPLPLAQNLAEEMENSSRLYHDAFHKPPRPYEKCGNPLCVAHKDLLAAFKSYTEGKDGH